VCALLKEHGIRYIAADLDAPTVTRDRRDGHDVFYGDASDTKFLEACGLATAAGVIITIHTHDLIDVVVEHVRALRPDVLIVSRARDADHVPHCDSPSCPDIFRHIVPLLPLPPQRNRGSY